jgi:hypothetical protein
MSRCVLHLDSVLGRDSGMPKEAFSCHDGKPAGTDALTGRPWSIDCTGTGELVQFGKPRLPARRDVH